jgi:hypothetical protein
MDSVLGLVGMAETTPRAARLARSWIMMMDCGEKVVRRIYKVMMLKRRRRCSAILRCHTI